MDSFMISIVLVASLFVIGYKGFDFRFWAAWLGALVWFVFDPGAIGWIVFIAVMVPFLVPSLRESLISARIISLLKKMNLLPKISQTEKTALRAGDKWLDAEFFSGNPDFRMILNETYPELTTEEKSFIDNEANEVCELVDNWKVYQDRDLSPEVWEYLKKNRFFGMIIPKEHGGLGFSATGHSSIVQKLATRSEVLAITVMVPNSLGPAELLVHYGTQAQKDKYLNALAVGEEIPCFALTEPLAGSDATSINANGEVFKDENGETKIRLNWEKRYITLGSIATVIGLAFNLKDPDNILEKGVDVGITCALVPSSFEGVERARRLDPLGVPFINSYMRGENVVISLDEVIGGIEGAGEGWKMLMDSLSVGRGISLPATSCGGSKLVNRTVSAYAAIRKQFGTEIGRFEGIESKVADIAATTYMLEAARLFTVGAIDSGKKPAVVNALMKYQTTEAYRRLVTDGMDVLGGAGIIRGPRNILANGYISAPIGITVEGANIMTRSLIIFGQGVIRAHPYAYSEIEALENNDVSKFDTAFFSHIGFSTQNAFRSMLLTLTRGYLYSPVLKDKTGRYEQKLVWSSARFAFLADMMLLVYGGAMKQKEQLNGRFADVLSWMYLLSSVLRRYEAEGRQKDDFLMVDYIFHKGLHEIDMAYDAIYKNLGSGVFRVLFRYICRPLTRINPLSSSMDDSKSAKVAKLVMNSQEARGVLSENIFISKDSEDGLKRLEDTFELRLKVKDAMNAVKKAVKSRKLEKNDDIYSSAVEKGIISEEDAKLIEEYEIKAFDTIMVDSFEEEVYKSHYRL